MQPPRSRKSLSYMRSASRQIWLGNSDVDFEGSVLHPWFHSARPSSPSLCRGSAFAVGRGQAYKVLPEDVASFDKCDC